MADTKQIPIAISIIHKDNNEHNKQPNTLNIVIMTKAKIK